MRFVHHHPGVTPSEVAQATGLQRSNLSTVLRILEGKGLVERSRDTGDRRGVVLQPTPLSDHNLTILRTEWAMLFEAALGDGPDNRAQLSACVTLLRHLETGLVSARRMPIHVGHLGSERSG